AVLALAVRLLRLPVPEHVLREGGRRALGAGLALRDGIRLGLPPLAGAAAPGAAVAACAAWRLRAGAHRPDRRGVVDLRREPRRRLHGALSVPGAVAAAARLRHTGRPGRPDGARADGATAGVRVVRGRFRDRRLG